MNNLIRSKIIPLLHNTRQSVYLIGSAVYLNDEQVGDLDSISLTDKNTNYSIVPLNNKGLKLLQINRDDLNKDISKKIYGGFYSSRFINPIRNLTSELEEDKNARLKAMKSHFSEFVKYLIVVGASFNSSTCLRDFIVYRGKFFPSYLKNISVLKKHGNNKSVKSFIKIATNMLVESWNEVHKLSSSSIYPSISDQVNTYWQTRANVKRENIDWDEVSSRYNKILNSIEPDELGLIKEAIRRLRLT